MRQLLIRADDIGYSYAVDLGIARSINEGLVRSAGLMPNMPEAARGWSLVADADIAVGQHTNVCLGKPCADPALIPSMLDENGEFQKWEGTFTGTSNVYLAMKYDLIPIGTMSHQLVSFEENVTGVFECNFNVMRKFSDVYDGDNGIYLYDCFGDDVFFSNLSKRMAMMYKGLRVDSGKEEEQLEKIIEKYKSLGIDPATKQVVYSNGLNLDRAIELHKFTAGRMMDSYGIGTYLTCDVTGCQPSNIVIKLTRSRITELREWHDCIKLSCDKGKTLGNSEKCNYILKLLGK